jgi:hypothetical protein
LAPGNPAKISVFQAVTISFEADDLSVVDEAVNHGGGHDVVGEDLLPTGRKVCWR